MATADFDTADVDRLVIQPKKVFRKLYITVRSYFISDSSSGARTLAARAAGPEELPVLAEAAGARRALDHGAAGPAAGVRVLGARDAAGRGRRHHLQKIRIQSLLHEDFHTSKSKITL